MGEFFKGWRRKIGVVTLLMALAFTGAWGRSLITVDRFTIPADGYTMNRLVSFRGNIALLRGVPGDITRESTDIDELPRLFHDMAEGVAEYLLGQLLSGEDKFDSKLRIFGFEIGEYHHKGSVGTIRITIWKLSHWLLITPLTLFSAFLLLSKPRQSTPKKTVQPALSGSVATTVKPSVVAD